jgi:penicillin-binding protein 2
MVEGLTASCNPVFYTLGKRLNDKNPFLLAQYSRQFGFGAKVGLDVGYESAGIVPDPNWKRATQGEVWVTGDNVNFSIGQGYMLATPLQIAQMTSVIANNGTLVRPRLVTKIIDPDTNELTAIKPMSSTKLTVAPDVVRNIQQGMIGVTTNTRIGTAENKFSSFDYYFVGNKIYAGNNVTVTKNLTSTNAIPILAASQRNEARKIIVAGKTGTAQAPGPRDLPFAWFTGYAPADNPQIVITVMLENVGEGSTFAAPLARKVIEAYFGLPSLP